MSTTVQKVSKINRAIKTIIAATFPQYAGRKVKVCMSDAAPSARASGWSEGSKTDVRIYNTRTGGVVYVHEDGQIDATGMTDVVLVEQSMFCGKDCGITIRMQKITGDDEYSVLVDSVLAAGMVDTWDRMVDATPGMEWGSYDKGHERATRRDVLLAVLESNVKDLRKGESRAVAS